MKNKHDYTEEGLFEGDIMVDDALGAAVNIQARKWPKSDDGFVYIPISFPASASKDEKSAIARTVTEFKKQHMYTVCHGIRSECSELNIIGP